MMNAVPISWFLTLSAVLFAPGTACTVMSARLLPVIVTSMI